MTSWLRMSRTVKKMCRSSFNSMIALSSSGTPNRMQDPTNWSTNRRWWIYGWLMMIAVFTSGKERLDGRADDSVWHASDRPRGQCLGPWYLEMYVACAEMLHVARCWHLNVKIWEGAVLSFDKMVANGIDPGYVSLLQAGAKGWWCQYYKRFKAGYIFHFNWLPWAVLEASKLIQYGWETITEARNLSRCANGVGHGLIVFCFSKTLILDKFLCAPLAQFSWNHYETRAGHISGI